MHMTETYTMSYWEYCANYEIHALSKYVNIEENFNKTYYR